MSKLKYLPALLLIFLCCAVCACKTPEPELCLRTDIFEAGEKIDLTSYAYVRAAEDVNLARFDPSLYSIRLADPAAFDPYKLGVQEISFIVTYTKKGEEFPFTRTVIVEDNIAPQFSAKAASVQVRRDIVFNVEDYFSYSDQGTPDLSDAIIVLAPQPDTSLPGTQMIHATVTDRAGNSSSADLELYVSKESVTMIPGQTYEEDGVAFEILSAKFTDTIIPEDHGPVYTYLPDPGDGKIYCAVRLNLINHRDEALDMADFFYDSLLYMETVAFRYTLISEADGNLSDNVTLDSEESGVFYMVFLIPEERIETTDGIYFAFNNFTYNRYSCDVNKD